MTDTETKKLGEVGFWPLKFELWATRFPDVWRVELVRTTKFQQGEMGVCAAQLHDDGTIRLQKSNTIGQREPTHDYQPID